MQVTPRETPLPSEDRTASVETLLATLDKVLRGIRLYEGHGDLLERLYQELERKLAAAVADGDVTLRVAPFGLLFQGKPVTPEDKRLAYLFRLYCDGLRELTLSATLGLAELKSFLQVLSRDVREGDEDLVTLLWKLDLRGIETYAVDAFVPDTRIDGDGTFARQRGKRRVDRARDAGEQQVVLSPDDLRAIHADDALAWARVARAPVRASGADAERGAALCHQADAGGDVSRFVDIALEQIARKPGKPSPLLLGVWDSALLHRQEDVGVALLAGVAAWISDPAADRRAAAHQVWGAFSEPERMRRLAPFYTSDPERLAPLLATASEGGGAELLPLLLALEPGAPQRILEELLRERAVDLTPVYRARLEQPDEAAMLEAIAALGRIASDEAAEALCEAVRHNRTHVRAAALEALKGCPPEKTRAALARALRDPEKLNRRRALELLRDSRSPRAAGFVLSAINERDFGARDADEQEAFLRALASFRDGRTADFFRALLEQVHLGRGAALVTRQLLAVEALEQIGNEAAEEALRAQRRRWHHAQAVTDAIRAAIKRLEAKR